MNDRIIKFRSYTDVESLKMFILQKLNLVDLKKDCVEEFYDRLKNYIDRDHSLKITFQFDRDELEKDMKFKQSLINKVQQPYPDNYEMGNPHNRWIFDPIARTEEEMDREKMELEKVFQEKLVALKQFLDRLEKIGNGQICIKDN